MNAIATTSSPSEVRGAMPAAQHAPATPTPTEMRHFLLVKQADLNSTGAPLTARASALILLDQGIWPLWTNTRCRLQVQAGDQVAIYLAGTGNQVVIAAATVANKTPWKASMLARYPLSLGGAPVMVLHLANVHRFDRPVPIHQHLPHLSFVGTNPKKWGVGLMGGMRSVNPGDFKLLTTVDL